MTLLFFILFIMNVCLVQVATPKSKGMLKRLHHATRRITTAMSFKNPSTSSGKGSGKSSFWAAAVSSIFSR